MRAEMGNQTMAFPRTLFVKWRRLPLAGDRDVIGDVPPMLVLRLVCASWRTYAALFLVLAMLVGLPGDVLAADVQVAIVQPGDSMTLRYDPSSQSVSVGSTVTWTNNGSTAVTITSPDGLFDSETVQPGSSFSHTFDTPGTFRYFCVPYPHMKGVIVVSP
jgi:plastocyanin